MSFYSDIVGTVLGFFRIGGTSGVTLKNSTGNLVVRNAADAADAALTASKVSVSGDVVDINSDAAGAGADWKYTLQRPATGMTAAVTLTLPPDDGTANQVLMTDGAGVLSWASAASTASSNKLDTTSLAFGTASPLTLFTTGAGDIIDEIEVIIDTSFNGAPSLSIGVAGTTSKYMPATSVDLTAAATTRFVTHPGLPAAGVESLIATYAAGGASVGSARIIIHFATPA